MVYKIGIVDDHRMMTEAIAGMINQNAKFKIVCEAKNGQEVKEQLNYKDKVPDLFLMDINMPVMNGIETTEWLKSCYPEVRVLALSMNDDEMSIIKMFQAGAKGYLLKDAGTEELFYAMESIMHRGFYYSDYVAPIMMNKIQNPTNTQTNGVTLKDKEMEFLKMVCSEMTYKEIADQMHLSPKTIDGYRDDLFHKLDVKSRVGLVMYAIKNGLYSL